MNRPPPGRSPFPGRNKFPTESVNSCCRRCICLGRNPRVQSVLVMPSATRLRIQPVRAIIGPTVKSVALATCFVRHQNQERIDGTGAGLTAMGLSARKLQIAKYRHSVLCLGGVAGFMVATSVSSQYVSMIPRELCVL